MSEFLVIYIKTLYDGEFQFYQSILVRKVLESTGMEHCNGFPTLTKVEAPLGKYENVSEANIYWPKSYASVIGMILYLESKTTPDIYFSVHRCARFTHYKKASHEMFVKRIFRYLQGTKDKGLLFNLYNKLVVGCYADADFSGMWGHENLQKPICGSSRTVIGVTFSNYHILWVPKIYT